MSSRITIDYTDGHTEVVRMTPRAQIDAADWLTQHGHDNPTDNPIRYACAIAYIDHRHGGGSKTWDAWLDSIDDISIQAGGAKDDPTQGSTTGRAARRAS